METTEQIEQFGVWWYKEADGHLTVPFYRYSTGRVAKVDGAELQARRVCVRCGAVSWRAVRRGYSKKDEKGRLRYMQATLKGEVVLPWGEVPKWNRTRIKETTTPVCTPNESLPWLAEVRREYVEACEQQRIVDTASQQVEKLLDKARDAVQVEFNAIETLAQAATREAAKKMRRKKK